MKSFVLLHRMSRLDSKILQLKCEKRFRELTNQPFNEIKQLKKAISLRESSRKELNLLVHGV